jgi:SAM-dependent methyltransferase
MSDRHAAEFTSSRIAYWDDYSANIKRWMGGRGYYRQRISDLYGLLIPPGMRILELGCGDGDLLASLKPSYGYGVDFSPGMVELGRRKHPHLNFEIGDAHDFEFSSTFDYILLSDIVNDAWDVQRLLEVASRHAHPDTRIIANFYSHLWQGPRKIAEALGIAKPLLTQNWLTTEDVGNLCYLANLEVIRSSPEIMWPFRTLGLEGICNKYLVRFWPFRLLAMTNTIVARPRPGRQQREHSRVSVVVPARNEAGNIAAIFDRVPQMGAGTELIFVEGHSRDDTYDRISAEISAHPEWSAKLFRQIGKGKGDAVRLGFAESNGEVLMILDADLTVPPEDLSRFYDAWYSGKGDFINGVRLVYPMEDKAMRFFNLLANKFFGQAFSWLLGQDVRDSLCGTKVLTRRNYATLAANRAYFGEIDPFGDFDLLFGAARYNLKIVDLPVRYRERKYGETNIQRWSHGWLLLRMVALASRRIRFV